MQPLPLIEVKEIMQNDFFLETHFKKGEDRAKIFVCMAEMLLGWVDIEELESAG